MGNRPKPRNAKPPLDLPGCVWVPLTRAQFALIDAVDAPAILGYAWLCHRSGYAARGEYEPKTRKTRYVALHRQLMGFPEGLEVDHINGNRLDNRRSNLRLVTPKEQARNRRRTPTLNSPYKGVFWMRRNQKWQAQICVDEKIKYLGLFPTAEAAALAYNTAAVLEFGEYASINLVPPHVETRVGHDTKKLTIEIAPDVHRALKIEAAERKMSMAAIIIEALMMRIRFLPRELRKDEKENK